MMLGIAPVQAQEHILLTDYHILQAPNDSARYDILRQAHEDAYARGLGVCYEGIDTLYLTIPANAKPIPLGCLNDFGNTYYHSPTIFVVKNNSHDLFLFERKKGPIRLETTDNEQFCRAINSGDYSAYPQLAKGSWLLHITDSNAWVGHCCR